jgi:hypothetical protein
VNRPSLNIIQHKPNKPTTESMNLVENLPKLRLNNSAESLKSDYEMQPPVEAVIKAVMLSK